MSLGRYRCKERIIGNLERSGMNAIWVEMSPFGSRRQTHFALKQTASQPLDLTQKGVAQLKI